MFRASCWSMRSRGAMLLIAVLQLLLLCIQDGRTWPDNYLPESTNTNLIKYFKVDTGKTSDIDVVLNVEALINELRCSNNKSVGLLEVTIKNGNLDQDEMVLYWNTKAILLKIPPLSPLANYTKEHTIELQMHYSCDILSDSSFREVLDERIISVKLRPLSIKLQVPSGELVEGQPLKLTCSILGYIPKKSSSVRVEFESSVADINTDCSDMIPSNESNNSVPHKSLIRTCEVNSRTNLSNSGYYSCGVTIVNEDTNLSSDLVNVNVERDWEKVIIGGSVGFAALILIAIIIAINIIAFVVIKRRRREYRPEERRPLLIEESMEIGHNRVRNFNQRQRGHVDDHRNVEGNLDNNNLDEKRNGRNSPFGSAHSSVPEEVVLSDEGGYESAV